MCWDVDLQRNYTVIPLLFVRAPEIASPLEVGIVGKRKTQHNNGFLFLFFLSVFCLAFQGFFFFFHRCGPWPEAGNYLAALLVLA